MKSNKIFISITGAIVATIFSGCAMCNDPIQNDKSCIEPSHDSSNIITPTNIDYTQPKIAPCTDIFKANFEAGKERVVVTGTGNSLEAATNDAIARFMEKANCDYIVGTTRIVTVKTHPTWRFFSTSNYTVKLSGIPVSLSRLEKVTPPKPAPVVEVAPLTKDDVKQIIDLAIKQNNKKTTVIMKEEKKCCPLGLVKLTDINIKVDAKAIAEDPAGLVFPAKKK